MFMVVMVVVMMMMMTKKMMIWWWARLTSDHRLMTLLPARECHRPMMPQERSDEQIHNQSAHNQDGHSDKQSKWGWQKLVYNCEESYYPSVRLTSCLHWYPVNKNYTSDPSINSFVEHINIKTASIFIWAKKLHICMWSEKNMSVSCPFYFCLSNFVKLSFLLIGLQAEKALDYQGSDKHQCWPLIRWELRILRCPLSSSPP